MVATKVSEPGRFIFGHTVQPAGCPGSAVAKYLPAKRRRHRRRGLIPGLTPGEGNGNPLQYCYLENSMNRGAWRATVYGVAKRDTTEHAHTYSRWSAPSRNRTVLPAVDDLSAAPPGKSETEVLINVSV